MTNKAKRNDFIQKKTMELVQSGADFMKAARDAEKEAKILFPSVTVIKPTITYYKANEKSTPVKMLTLMKYTDDQPEGFTASMSINKLRKFPKYALDQVLTNDDLKENQVLVEKA